MVNAVINENLDIKEIIDNSMTPALHVVGEKFQSGEMFLPELQLAADAFTAAMDMLQPKILTSKTDLKPKGRVIIGTVKGDLHSIGKDLVATMLTTAGFNVVDLGVDVSTFAFLDEAEKEKTNIIALSALLTTTMTSQREVIEALKDQGLREKYKVIIGGAPVNEAWANEIGADAYGENAAQAVTLANKLSNPAQ
jgi:corrinoid protein of di/trimethylamine methyltransferase